MQIHACTHTTYTCIYTFQVFTHVYKLKLSLYPTEEGKEVDTETMASPTPY